MSDSQSSSGIGELVSRLDERIRGFNSLLAEPAWRPSRSHIEAIRNLLRDAADALRASSPTPQIAEGVREALIEKEAKRRCIEAEIPLEHLACQDRRFRHDDHRPWWQAMYVHKIKDEIERLEKAGFALSPQAQAGETQRCDRCGSSGDTYVLCSGCGALAQASGEYRCVEGRENLLLIAHEIREARNAYLDGIGQVGNQYRRDKLSNVLHDDATIIADALEAYASPPAALPAGEALADKIIADPKVTWLRECGFQSSARFESELRAAILRACALPSTTREIPAVDRGIECWSIVEQLRANEGAEVILLCDNPDFNGQPNNAIEICDDWTRWNIQRFTGDTMLDCLRAALKARETKTEGVQLRSNPNLKPGLEKAAEIVGNMRQSEAGIFDAAHSGQRGEDRSTALYDAYQAIKKAVGL